MFKHLSKVHRKKLEVTKAKPVFGSALAADAPPVSLPSMASDRHHVYRTCGLRSSVQNHLMTFLLLSSSVTQELDP